MQEIILSPFNSFRSLFLRGMQILLHFLQNETNKLIKNNHKMKKTTKENCFFAVRPSLARNL